MKKNPSYLELRSKYGTILTLSIGTPYLHTILVLKFESPFYYLMMCLNYCFIYGKQCRLDQMPHSVASDLGLHCLQKLCSVSSDLWLQCLQRHISILSQYLRLLWYTGLVCLHMRETINPSLAEHVWPVSANWSGSAWFVIKYEGKSISNQPIPFPIDRDTQDIPALFQYMF